MAQPLDEKRLPRFLGRRIMVLERLLNAIGTGEIIGIIYHGGSQPGSFRDIAPIQIEGDKVRARCYTSGAVKQFVLAKIELRGVSPTDEDKAKTWDRDHVSVPRYSSIEEIHKALAERLTAGGWVVALDGNASSDVEGQSLSLRSGHKNGKLKKWPDVALAYQAIGHVPVANDDGTITLESTGPRTRPWVVRSKGHAVARTFADVDRAVEVFVQQALLLAPSSK